MNDMHVKLGSPIDGDCWYCEKPMYKGDVILVGGVTRKLAPVRVHFGCVKQLCKFAEFVIFKRKLLQLIGARRPHEPT